MKSINLLIIKSLVALQMLSSVVAFAGPQYASCTIEEESTSNCAPTITNPDCAYLVKSGPFGLIHHWYKGGEVSYLEVIGVLFDGTGTLPQSISLYTTPETQSGPTNQDIANANQVLAQLVSQGICPPAVTSN